MAELPTDINALRTEVLELLCYLLTAARGVIYEARLYAPYRLAEGARRLIVAMERAGIGGAQWREVAEEIERSAMRMISDEDACKRILDDLVLRLTAELKRG
jgi:hypothetical protein